MLSRIHFGRATIVLHRERNAAFLGGSHAEARHLLPKRQFERCRKLPADLAVSRFGYRGSSSIPTLHRKMAH
jgi:hypothetical protein